MIMVLLGSVGVMVFVSCFRVYLLGNVLVFVLKFGRYIWVIWNWFLK